MKKTMNILSALAIAAVLTVITTACSQDDSYDASREGAVPKVHISVGVGLDEGTPTRSTVTQSGTSRTLTFTASDKLYVNGDIEISDTESKVLAGFLTIDASSIGSAATSATFSGDLDVYEENGSGQWVPGSHDFGGAADPLAACSYISAQLVHAGTESGFAIGDRKMGQYSEHYIVASDVNALMTSRLVVKTPWQNGYDSSNRRFNLEATDFAILNCTISGLEAGQSYSVKLGQDLGWAAVDYGYTGSATANASGTATFAIFAEVSEGVTYTLKLIDGEKTYTVDLGAKDLDAKIYNVTRTAVAPAAPAIAFSATISKADYDTDALSDAAASTDLNADWTDGDHVALVYQVGSETMVADATVTPGGSKTATITATLDGGVTDGTAVTIVYPYSAVNEKTGAVRGDLFTAQAGTLADVIANSDLRQGTGTITVASGSASLGSSMVLAPQAAVWKLTLMNYEEESTWEMSTRNLTIKDGSGNTLAATATLATSQSDFYMAVPAISSTDIRIETTYGSEAYVQPQSGVTLAAGTACQGTVKLARPLSGAKMPYTEPPFYTTKNPADVGNVVSADGRIFTTAAAATEAGTSAVALICQVSSAGHGLALELNDAPPMGNWSSACDNPTSKAAVPGGSWRLPSKQDWTDMLVGFLDSNTTAVPVGGWGYDDLAYTSLKAKYNATGQTLWTVHYWSSTEADADQAWGVGFDTKGTKASFSSSLKANTSYVLACLAF